MNIPRREFIRQAGAGVVVGALAPASLMADGQPQSGTPSTGSVMDLPARRLGRIGRQVPVLSFGTAPMGHALYSQEDFDEVIHAALDAGLIYMDTAPTYDVSQERLGRTVERRRGDIFLVTKTRAKTRDDALRDVERSLQQLRTDYADACLIHNLGDLAGDAALGSGGTLEGLIEARRRGWIRHIGCSGHMLPGRFIPVIETGEIDLIMVAMNFVDRNTYNFEEKVLPVARKHDCGIACMKVYGGVTGGWDGYSKRRPGRLAGDEHRQAAVDYALSIPGVSTCVIGMKTLGELRLAIEAVRNHQPLQGQRREDVLALGVKMAGEWKAHLGPAS